MFLPCWVWLSRRAYSIKTRIKTLLKISLKFLILLAEHIPLKQGLRRRISAIKLLISSRRAYSIKTRIKTLRAAHLMKKETLAEHIPLKQGLRPSRNVLSVTASLLAEHIPLKQGLRHIWYCWMNRSNHSRRAYSIKTRIKTLCFIFEYGFGFVLAEHIPLKQGLRPRTHTRRGKLSSTRRAYSIKTRIKT